MPQKIVIHWFRQDLRLRDNPAFNDALEQAQQHNAKVLPIYILDDVNSGADKQGAASRVWLHHSLHSLNDSLDGALSVYAGDPAKVLANLSQTYQIVQICWNRCYEPWRINRDTQLKATWQQQGIAVTTCNSALLWEPWTIQKKDATPYKVFTPFYRKGCLFAPEPRRPLTSSLIKEPLQTTTNSSLWLHDDQQALSINDLALVPSINATNTVDKKLPQHAWQAPNAWQAPMASFWDISEAGAHKRFAQFMQEGLNDYKEGRNLPAKPYVSKLSPYLHFGQISPNQLWYQVRSLGDSSAIDHFCSELGWREFSYNLLFYNPHLTTQNLQKKFDHFAWVNDASLLAAWQQGQTGVPMVDAGMRQLWQTGHMHNRVRMIVGSFLVKNLRLHWHHGERWFWDTLVDADMASNSASWQWIAGCGADAAPYFRIFNPVTQGERFDPQGEYVRHYIPELAALPNKYICCPWQAPTDVLQAAKVQLGQDYPLPIVDLKISRQQALDAFQALKTVD